MRARFPVFLAAGLAAAAAASAAFASPEKSYLFEEGRFANACQYPYKYAAGACVAVCPAGYEDNGRTCAIRNQNFR